MTGPTYPNQGTQWRTSGGFSGKRSFYRALERWTGETPGAFRRRATEPPPAP